MITASQPPGRYLPLPARPRWESRLLSFNGVNCTIIFIIVLLSFGLVCAETSQGQAEVEMPFKAGEKATYRLRWGFIPAGEAALEVMAAEDCPAANGAPAYHFVLTANSNAVVDVLYKVRDRIDSYADQAMTNSLLYKKNQQEGRSRRDIVVHFDWQRNLAQYTNFNEQLDPIAIMAGSFDPLAIFFFIRMVALEEGKELTHPVTDGKKNLLGLARVIRRESITVPAGTFDTYLLAPDLRDIGGVFEKSPNARIEIWVSADDRKMLVKIKSKVIVGSFTAELLSYCP